MTESYSVPEMRAHQASLQGVDSATQALVSHAADLGIGDEQMYGMFASPIVCPILRMGNTAHGGTIKELGQVSTAAAEAFKTTADLYEASEKANVDLSQAILTQINDTERRTRR